MWVRRVLSPATVGVVAPGPDSFRGPRTLSGTPRPNARVHHTTVAAASPVRASARASEEGEKEEDHDEMPHSWFKWMWKNLLTFKDAPYSQLFRL